VRELAGPESCRIPVLLGPWMVHKERLQHSAPDARPDAQATFADQTHKRLPSLQPAGAAAAGPAPAPAPAAFPGALRTAWRRCRLLPSGFGLRTACGKGGRRDTPTAAAPHRASAPQLHLRSVTRGVSAAHGAQGSGWGWAHPRPRSRRAPRPARRARPSMTASSRPGRGTRSAWGRARAALRPRRPPPGRTRPRPARARAARACWAGRGWRARRGRRPGRGRRRACGRRLARLRGFSAATARGSPHGRRWAASARWRCAAWLCVASQR